jgi:hypothetical protein
MPEALRVDDAFGDAVSAMITSAARRRMPRIVHSSSTGVARHTAGRGQE